MGGLLFSNKIYDLQAAPWKVQTKTSGRME